MDIDGSITWLSLVVAIGDRRHGGVKLARRVLPRNYGLPDDILAELIERCVEEFKEKRRAETAQVGARQH